MLEANDYAIVNMVSPFLEILEVRCGGLPDTAYVKTVYSKFTIIVSILCRWNIYQRWPEEHNQAFELLVQKCSIEAFHLFRK